MKRLLNVILIVFVLCLFFINTVSAEDCDLGPFVVGAININDANDVYVVSNYAYVADYSSLKVIDITDPDSPQVVGSVDTYYAQGVYVSGNYAYVADGDGGLKVIDIIDPASPQIVGSVDTDYARGVYVTGNYAYVVTDVSLIVIDITDPASPQIVGSVDTVAASSVYVTGNYAYVICLSALQIIDITDPTSPVIVGSVGTYYALGVYVSGNYAYVADRGSLKVVDITDPASPQIVSSIGGVSHAEDVYVSGNYAYVTGRGPCGWLDCSGVLKVIDITDPISPQIVGSVNSRNLLSVHIANNYAYVVDGNRELNSVQEGLKIIDITDPTSPLIVGSVDTNGNGSVGLYVTGNYAYVADGSAGLKVIDIIDPASPQIVGSVNTGYSNDVYVTGNYAYVATNVGLIVVDISNPASPQIVGSVDTDNSASNVYVTGNYAYLASYVEDLMVIDITDPTSPQIVGSVNTGYSNDVYVTGNHAYVATSGGLIVVDITDPTSPFIVGSVDTTYQAKGVYVIGNYAYVVIWTGGLKIIDITCDFGTSVNPTIAQDPMEGPPGTTFTQWGTGFTPYSTATLHFQKPDGNEYPTQEQAIDANGNFEITYTAPLDKEPGIYTWWAIDEPTGIKSNEVNYTITSDSQSTYTLTLSKTGAGTGTVTSNSAGIDCGSSCNSSSYDYTQGASVTLTATADTGSTFAGWSGCDSTTGNQCIVTMGADRDVIAVFNPQGSSDCSINIGDLIVTGDNCIEDAGGYYTVYGNITISSSSAPGSYMLKIYNDTMFVDTELKTINAPTGEMLSFYTDNIALIGTVDIALGSTFHVSGNSLSIVNAVWNLISDSELIERLFGYNLDIKAMTIGSDNIMLEGNLTLPKAITLILFTEGDNKKLTPIDVSITSLMLSRSEGIAIKGIEVTAQGLDKVVDEIKIDGLPLTLKELTVSAEEKNDKFYLSIGGGFEVKNLLPSISGGISLVDAWLDTIWLEVSGLNVPIGTTPFFLNALEGKVKGLLTLSPPVIKTTASFSGGPNILSLFKLACFNKVGSEIDAGSYFKVMGNAGLLCSDILDSTKNGAISAYLEGGIDWKKKSLFANGSLTYPFDIIQADGSFSISPTEINGNFIGRYCSPGGLPFIGNECFANIESILNNKGTGSEISFKKFIDFAVFIEWAIAKSKNTSEALNYIHVGKNLEELGFKSAQAFKHTLRDSTSVSTTTIAIPHGLDKTIIRLSDTGSPTDFYLLTPDGTFITPDDGETSDSVVYMKLDNETWYGLKNPQGGDYVIEVMDSGTSAKNGAANYTLTSYSMNSHPGAVITAPADKVSTSTVAEIQYTAQDPDDTAALSLYYDSDNTGADGIPIVTGLTEKDGSGSYTWDVSSVPPGIYYVYAVVDDGKNVPVVGYSTGVVEVISTAGLEAPSGLNALAMGNQIDVSWNSVTDAAGYNIYYTDNTGTYTYKDHVCLDNSFTSYTFENMKPDTTYRITITAFDSEISESDIASPVTVTTGDATVPAISFSTEQLDFDNIDNASETLSITNTGDADLIITSITVSGADAEKFSLSLSEFPLTITAQQTTDLDIVFTPDTDTDVSAALIIESNDPSVKSKVIPIKVDTLLTITASAGSNGAISPSGSVKVEYGEEKTFTFTPDSGYGVLDVLVDGVSIGSVNSYTFDSVKADHTISVQFETSYLSQNKGTLGTEITISNVNSGRKKPVVYYEVQEKGKTVKKQFCKVTEKVGTSLRCRVKAKTQPGPYNVMVKVKKKSHMSAGLFTVMAPEIDTVSPSTAEAGTKVELSLTGSYFGLKKPKVYIEYLNAKKKTKKRKCKVIKSTLTMDNETGASELTCKCKISKKIPAGIHTLILKNKIGVSKKLFSITLPQ